ncbi:MAG: hypothetical protein H8E21_12130 [Gammaproteobacteria bacterium]|nr:hypothetical protein [Gammaproteobacteria bacterium]
MRNNKLSTAISTILITSALAACGGGSDSSVDTPLATDVTSSGVITQFGSVYVNGVRYKTENSTIISADDGSELAKNPSDDVVKSLLGLGQVVTVRGTRTDDSNGTASTIIFDNELAGKVSSVSADASFVILGQTISITPDTIIDDSLIEAVRQSGLPSDQRPDLRFGDPLLTETLDQLLPIDSTIIVVSGFPSQNGFEATRIEDGTNTVGSVTPGTFTAEVKGRVSNHTGSQFTLNGLTVQYLSSALDSEDFPDSTPLADGMFVEVHGSVDSATQITATRIEREDLLDKLVDSSFSSGELEIEGVIQKVVADATGTGGLVTINGYEIRVNDVAQFSQGLRIEIKGRLQFDGSLSVTRIKDEAEDNVRTEDNVVSADANSFVTRLGLTITPKDRTRLEDDINDIDNPSISTFLGNVDGQRIEARGYPINGTTTWTRLEISKDNDNDCRLRGTVADKSGTDINFTFTIQGVTINVSQVLDSNFEDGSNLTIGRTAFFNQLNDGDIVQATSDNAGTGCVNGTLTAREVEFEPQDSVLLGSSSSSSSSTGGSTSSSNELNGPVSNVTLTSFVVAGETISVNAATVIDNSLIEDARNANVDDDAAFGTLTDLTLDDLLGSGLAVQVVVDRSSGSAVAVSIENI